MKKIKTMLILPFIASIFATNNALAAACTVVPCGITGGEETDMPITGICNDPMSEPLCVSKPTTSGGGTYSIGQCGSCGTAGYVSKLTTVTTPWGCTVQAKRCVKDDGSGTDPSEICPPECPSTSEWTSMGNNKEGKCMIFYPGFDEPGEASCTIRCAAGSYDIGVTPLTCIDCPENATCSGDESLPSCVKGYYRETDTGTGTRYKCTRCPGYYVGDTITFGQTVSAGATSKDQCYEPKGEGHVKKEMKFPNDISIGKYDILEDKACFYTK